MRFFRAFPSDPRAAPHERGGVLYIPPGGAGRIDNPDLYRVLYSSDSREGAVAEAFGRFPIWNDEMFIHANDNRYAIAEFEIADSAPICDLDSTQQLAQLNMKPSDVVSRDRIKTHAWARAIFGMSSWIGISWWSYYEPSWRCFGLWDITSLTVIGNQTPLEPRSPAVQEAAKAIVRLVRE